MSHVWLTKIFKNSMASQIMLSLYLTEPVSIFTALLRLSHSQSGHKVSGNITVLQNLPSAKILPVGQLTLNIIHDFG